MVTIITSKCEICESLFSVKKGCKNRTCSRECGRILCVRSIKIGRSKAQRELSALEIIKDKKIRNEHLITIFDVEHADVMI